MNRFVIVFLLPKHLEGSLNQIREHFEPGASSKIPPHLSVSYPFFFGQPIETLTSKISGLASGFSPMETTITGTGVFEKESQGQIIYAEVHPKEELCFVFETIKTTVLKDVTFDTTIFGGGQLPPYVPHITLALKANVASEDWLKTKLSFLFGTRFTLKDLALFSYKRGPAIWKMERLFPLEERRGATNSGVSD